MAYSYRRPETADPAAFWHCGQEKWDQWMQDSASAATKKNALNNIRKFDAAGRIMETDEGCAAPSPCAWCTREGLAVDCRTYAGREDLACAYCKRHGKPGCSAGAVPVVDDDDEEEEKPGIRQDIAQLTTTCEALDARCTALNMRIELLVREGEKQQAHNAAMADELKLLNLKTTYVMPKLDELNATVDTLVWLKDRLMDWTTQCRMDIWRLWNHNWPGSKPEPMALPLGPTD